jgi:hypothetical protein
MVQTGATRSALPNQNAAGLFRLHAVADCALARSAGLFTIRTLIAVTGDIQASLPFHFHFLVFTFGYIIE